MKRKYFMAALVAAFLCLIGSGCLHSKASGKLQIMYSGNIRGNVSPCG